MRQGTRPAELLEEVRAAAERVRNGRPRAREQLRAALEEARTADLPEQTLAMASRDLPPDEPQHVPGGPRRRPRLVRMRWND